MWHHVLIVRAIRGALLSLFARLLALYGRQIVPVPLHYALYRQLHAANWRGTPVALYGNTRSNLILSVWS